MPKQTKKRMEFFSYVRPLLGAPSRGLGWAWREYFFYFFGGFPRSQFFSNFFPTVGKETIISSKQDITMYFQVNFSSIFSEKFCLERRLVDQDDEGRSSSHHLEPGILQGLQQGRLGADGHLQQKDHHVHEVTQIPLLALEQKMAR